MSYVFEYKEIKYRRSCDESIEINITKYLIEELNYCRHLKSVQELTLSRWDLEGKKKTLS